MTPEAFRRRFPIFEHSIYLNSCSQGALSKEVEAAYASYLESWRERGSPWDEWVGVLEAVRSRYASYLGCGEDELAVTFCASTAVAGLLSALSFEGERRRIAIGAFEFPTVAHNLLAQARRGAEITPVPAEGAVLPVEAYERVVDRRTALVPVAHVCFRNGHRQDLASVIDLARSRGARTLVDDYQSTGTAPIDVSALGCDFLVTGTLKYLLGSSGVGFLYVRSEHLRELEPLVTGWFGQERPFDFDVERASYHRTARRFETGTPPVPNLFAARAALEVLQSVPPDAVAAHVERLTTRLVDGALARGLSLLTPLEPARRGPLAVVECEDAEGAVARLAEAGIVVSARGPGLRVSFHYYNVDADVDALLDALDGMPKLLVRN